MKTELKKVTEKLIERVKLALEKNENLRWDSPILQDFFDSFNCVWGTKYKGLFNKFLLGFVSSSHGDCRYVAASWVKSHAKQGARFAKGSHWTWILRPVKKMRVDENKAGEYGVDIDDVYRNPKDYPQSKYPSLIYFNLLGFDEIPVVNIQETTGIMGKLKDSDGKIIPEKMELAQKGEAKGTIQAFTEFAAKIPHKIVTSMSNPFYRPSTDEVGMPPLENLTTDYAMTEAHAHELIHWTGHKTRLDRSGIANNLFGDSLSYGKEELVASLGSSVLMTRLGITLNDTQVDRQAAYLKNWLVPLQNDPAMLVEAAGEAEKAVTFLMNLAQGEGV